MKTINLYLNDKQIQQLYALINMEIGKLSKLIELPEIISLKEIIKEELYLLEDITMQIDLALEEVQI